jgi:ABC-type multidrug transport system ATPase subunit
VRIILQNTGKKYTSEWIFRNLDYTFSGNHAYAILGRNGSGKSTLLQVISGNLHATEGTIAYMDGQKKIPDQKIFRHLAIVAPYQELIEEFTLDEMVRFHFSFKKLLPGFTLNDATEMLGFRVRNHKVIRQFSSGMKQRVKLLLAFLSDVPLLLLDEPTMNLDHTGMEWYLQLAGNYRKDRLLIICSNQRKQETGFCSDEIRIEEYKPVVVV